MKSPTRNADDLVQKFEEKVAEYLPMIGSRPANAEQAAKQLRAYHAIGKIADDLTPERAEYGDNLLKKMANAAGREVAWIFFARRFARAYSDHQLAKLCTQTQWIRWGHLQSLISLPPAKRNAWVKRIVANGWTPQKFRRELQQSKGKTQFGRKVAGADDAQDCVQQIAELSSRLLQYEKLLSDPKSPLRKGAPARLKKIHAALEKAAPCLEELQRLCSQVEIQLRNSDQHSD